MLFSPSVINVKPVFLKAAISVAVLSLVFYFVPISNVFSAILVTDPLWVFAGAVLLILLRVLTALRMQMIARAQGLDTNNQTMMRIVFTSTFYNILAPGALAGGAVTYLKYRQHGVSSVAAVANIFANKLIQLLVVLLSAPLFWLIDKGFSHYVIVSYGLIMVAGFSCAFALFFGRFGNLCWLESKIDHHGQSIFHRSLKALSRQVRKIGLISHRAIFFLVAYSAVHSLFAALAILCFGNALNIEIGLIPILWIYSVIYLLAMLPISISNIGVREVSMIMLLAPYGISMTEATTWSVLMYSGPLSCALIGLILEAEYYWLRKGNRRSIDATDYQVEMHNKNVTQGKSDERKPR